MRISKKRCKYCMLLFLLLLLTGCSVGNLDADKIKEAVKFHQKSEEPEEQEITEEQAAFLYGYQNLSADEQKIYRQLVRGLEGFQEDISLSPVSEEGLEKIFNRVMIDHPEYFWIEGSFQYYMETWPDGSTAGMKVMPDYLMNQEEAEQVQAKIEKKAQEWLSGASQEADTYEKIKYVYETLICNVDYEADSPDNQNIQSVFLEGRTVCMGYSKATQYLLNKMGIFCTLVTGTASDGAQQGNADTGHAWNLVKIGDEFYYVDTTWGNPGYSDAQDVVWRFSTVIYAVMKILWHRRIRQMRIYPFQNAGTMVIIIIRTKTAGMKPMTETRFIRLCFRMSVGNIIRQNCVLHPEKLMNRRPMRW